MFFTFKQCFSCKRNYPLFMFYNNNRKYQRPEMKNKVYDCRICSANKLYKTGKHVKLYNDKTFVVEKVQSSIINWIKKFFNKI